MPACTKLREFLATKLCIPAADAVFSDGHFRSNKRNVPLGEAVGNSGLVAEELMEYGEFTKEKQ
ncbi:hypothetical protein JIN84_17215 [Luteolibacter yonseiensis]|uniref:Uncharacterized protein n=1 Tax=Luteolibacter yonseiensis TaxID=1144680 RepID=A0A934R5K4_9BACT|nr:hypothetical protein [Luteolibacter yonseiensis]MBK1817364.1 hypothetical protein [Luteolibacter yonseiensis]